MLIRHIVLLLWVMLSLPLAYAAPPRVFLNETFDASGAGPQSLAARWHLDYARGVRGFRLSRYLDSGNPCARVDIPTGGQTIYSLHTILALNGYNGPIKVTLRYKSNKKVPVLASITGGHISKLPFIRRDMTTYTDEQWHQAEYLYDIAGLKFEQVCFEFIFDITNVYESNSYIQFDDIRVEAAMRPAVATLQNPGNMTFFEDETDQTLRVKVVTPEPAEYAFRVYDHESGGKLINEQILKIAESGLFEHNIKSLPDGIYRVEATKLNSDKPIGKWLVRKAPIKSDAVIIRDGVPYINGKPFMILGLYHTGDPIIKRVNEENRQGAADFEMNRKTLFMDLKERGFNTVFASWGAPRKEYLDDAQEQGLKVVAETRERIHTIQPIMDHPAILCWYGIDEPTIETLAKSQELYNQYRIIDPYHPVMTAVVTESSLAMRGQHFLDIAAVDDYPIRAADSRVNMKRFLEESRKNLNMDVSSACTIVVPQLYTMNMFFFTGFQPQYEQVRALTYSSITGGAKGFMYYSLYTTEPLTAGMPMNSRRKQWFLPESPLWNQVGQLNGELKELQDFILVGQTQEKVIVNASAMVVSRVMQCKGKSCMIIVNPTANEQKGIVITNWPEKGDALFDAAPLTPVGTGKWTLNLPAYGVGVYRISAR